ncbi:hypothetical protein D3C87_1058030 [compost metagenome]
MIERINVQPTTRLWSHTTNDSPTALTTAPTTNPGSVQALTTDNNGVPTTRLFAPQDFTLGPPTLNASQQQLTTETIPGLPMDGAAIHRAATAETRYVLSMIDGLGLYGPLEQVDDLAFRGLKGLLDSLYDAKGSLTKAQYGNVLSLLDPIKEQISRLSSLEGNSRTNALNTLKGQVGALIFDVSRIVNPGFLAAEIMDGPAIHRAASAETRYVLTMIDSLGLYGPLEQVDDLAFRGLKGLLDSLYDAKGSLSKAQYANVLSLLDPIKEQISRLNSLEGNNRTNALNAVKGQVGALIFDVSRIVNPGFLAANIMDGPAIHRAASAEARYVLSMIEGLGLYGPLDQVDDPAYRGLMGLMDSLYDAKGSLSKAQYANILSLLEPVKEQISRLSSLEGNNRTNALNALKGRVGSLVSDVARIVNPGFSPIPAMDGAAIHRAAAAETRYVLTMIDSLGLYGPLEQVDDLAFRGLKGLLDSLYDAKGNLTKAQYSNVLNLLAPIKEQISRLNSMEGNNRTNALNGVKGQVGALVFDVSRIVNPGFPAAGIMDGPAIHRAAAAETRYVLSMIDGLQLFTPLEQVDDLAYRGLMGLLDSLYDAKGSISKAQYANLLNLLAPIKEQISRFSSLEGNNRTNALNALKGQVGALVFDVSRIVNPGFPAADIKDGAAIFRAASAEARYVLTMVDSLMMYTPLEQVDNPTYLRLKGLVDSLYDAKGNISKNDYANLLNLLEPMKRDLAAITSAKEDEERRRILALMKGQMSTILTTMANHLRVPFR